MYIHIYVRVYIYIYIHIPTESCRKPYLWEEFELPESVLPESLVNPLGCSSNKCVTFVHRYNRKRTATLCLVLTRRGRFGLDGMLRRDAKNRKHCFCCF